MHVNVVLHTIRRHHNVSHNKIINEKPRNTRIDDAINLKAVNENLCAKCCVNLADA